MGLQLWFHAHGIDESNVHKPYRPKSRGIGNSQILPYDYHLQADIELVFREMAEQVAIRLRRKKKKTQLVSIHASYSKIEGLPSIHCQPKDWAHPIHQGFYPTRFCGSFALSTKVAPFGRLVFFMENLSRSLFNSFLFLTIQQPWKKRRNSSRRLTAFGTNLALPLFRKAPHY